MKVYEKRPAKEVIIVREGEAQENAGSYEFWILAPVYLGRATKVGNQRVITEDGQSVTNLKAAARHFLMQHDEKDLAAQQPLWTHKARNKVQVQGLDLVEKGTWAKFCEMRGLDPRNVAAMQQPYFLDQKEAEAIGL